MNISQRRIPASLFVSAMLTSALFRVGHFSTRQIAGPGNLPAAMETILEELGPAGWKTTGQRTTVSVGIPRLIRVSASEASGSQIPEDKLAKLIAIAMSRAQPGLVGKQLFGLPQGDEKLSIKQINIRAEGADHLFTVPLDDTVGRLAFSILDADGMGNIVTDRQGRMIAGFIRRSGGELEPLSEAEAQSLYTAEMMFWTTVADQSCPVNKK
jgi:hypothetical protein